MLFSSNVFLFLFLPITLIGYQLVSRLGRRAVALWLVAASLFFYGYWNPKYLLVLLASIAVNFAASRLITSAATPRHKTIVLSSAITANLALLFWFKYLFPLIHYFQGIGWLHRPVHSVLLPLGISFFTFTQIAYLIDLAQEEAEPQSLLSYLLFVTFFPHLIAGPIIHHAEMMPQFNADRRWGLRADDLAVGCTWFILGLGKKVLIADHFGPVADALYLAPAHYGAHATWVGVLCYAIQLYFDFSGYSDMALGLARMFSIIFPVNFNSPYKAASIIDFWQRWHMTLTRYLNLYLYNPIALAMSRRRIQQGLSANRKAQRSWSGFTQLIALPLFVTMCLAGIWHGAGMQFLLFGLAHALYLTANHAWRTFVPETSTLRRLIPSPLGVGLTFACVLVGQVFFRAASATDAWHVLGSMIGLHAGAALSGFQGLPVHQEFARAASKAWPQIIAIAAFVLLLPNTQQILGQTSDATPSRLASALRWRPNLAWAAAMIAVTVASLAMLASSTSFLYFQF